MMDPNKHEERSKLFKRSLKLLNRANSYAMRALKVKYPTLKVQIENKTNKEIAVAIESFPFIKEDIQTLYFAAASFAGTILSSRGDTHYVVKLPIVSALLRKSLSLDPDWNDGALHTAMISLVLQDLTKTKDQKKEQAIVYFHRAVMASNGNDCNPYVSLAENLSKQEQDKKAFLELINKALKVDTDKHFKNRLSNVLCQRKALWLRKNIDALFI